jgi:SnoaL-like domain
MTYFRRIARLSLITLLAAGVSSGPAMAKSTNTQLQQIIDQLSAPLSAPIQYPFLDADDQFSQGSGDDIAGIQQVFAAYVFYNDAGNGTQLAQLYTTDGVDDHGANDLNGLIVPTYGINGLGCVSTGQDQIATYIYRIHNDAPAQPFPQHSHHDITSPLIKVVGDAAMMVAVWYVHSNSANGTVSTSQGGEYLVTFRRTQGAWKIRTNHVIFDFPMTSTRCDLGGPLPR